MNYRIFTLLISILLLNTISFAQSDAPEDPLKIDKPRCSWLSINNKKWLKMEFKVTCKGDPTRRDSMWLDNIEFDLTCAYEYNNKEAKKRDVAWFNSDAKFYVMEKNKDYLLNFYIAWDVADRYSFLKTEPLAYVIDIKANGRDYPLNENNLTGRSNLRKPKEVSDFLAAKSNADTKKNEGAMLYYDDAPYLVHYNDTVSQVKLPTSVKKK